jgi:esterase/lipase superfamily enzyme
MKKETHLWKSPHLDKEMTINIYGHYGFAIMLFPSITDSADESEQNGMIDAIKPYLDKGKCRIFSVESVNHESWLNEKVSPEERSNRHFEYNNYIIEEVVPFIFSSCGGPVPILTAGAKHGAYHAGNKYFRRPDLFYGVIAMSGIYNLQHYCGEYFDQNCYFNSPIHYLPNLHDEYWLSFLMNKHHVYLLSGSGEDESPGNTDHLASILSQKGIPYRVCIWDDKWGHNWKTWNKMLAHVLETRL